jgi:hypothetical protein
MTSTDAPAGYGMTLTVLCTQLAEAVGKDEAPEVGGFDLSAGMFGPHVSQWLRDVAATIADARMISAAPDLLEALRPFAALAFHYPIERTYGYRPTSGMLHEISSADRTDGYTVEDLHRAAAIAKATGATP